MSDNDSTVGDYVSKEVYDATGTLLGTVADVDEENHVLYINPDPDPTEESWAEIGEGEIVNYDNNWLGVPDYKVWNEGDNGDIDFDEWPYTIDAEEVDEVTEDAIRLETTSLADIIRDLVPVLDSE